MEAEKIVEEWLSEYSNGTTEKVNRARLTKFLGFAETSLEDLLKLTGKEAKRLVLLTQRKMVDRGIKSNSILAYLGAVRALFGSDAVGKPLNFKRNQLVNPQMATGYHVFSNGDLGTMYEHGTIRMRALLAMSTSLGWEVSSIVDADRELFKNLVEKAISDGQEYVFFMSQRRKTGKPRLGVLNPLAITSLKKWFDTSKDTKTVFGVGEDQLNILLKRCAEQSGIKLTGAIRFHYLRGWLMSSLSKAGFNEFEVKFILGKSIGISDATYLRSLQSQIEEKYPEKYDRYLNILPISTKTKDLEGALQQAEQDIKDRDKKIRVLEARINSLRKGLNKTMSRLTRVENLVLPEKKPEKVEF